MVVEQAILKIRRGESAAFGAAMRKARPLIAASSGFQSIAVHPSLENPERFLLLVVWSDVAAHRDGFRKSDRYEQWRSLLHRFYEPMPTIEYFGESIV